MVKLITEQPISGVIHEGLSISRANWDHPSHLAYSHLHMNRMMPTTCLEPGSQPIQLPRSPLQLDITTMTFDDVLNGRPMNGEQFLNRRIYNDALLVFHRGQVIHESYRNGMQPEDHHLQHSTTKSLVAMLVGIAIDEGQMSAAAPISSYIPELMEVPAWKGVNLQHVLDMAAGIAYNEHYEDPNSPFFEYARAVGYYPQADGSAAIGARAWLSKRLNESVEPPGTHFNYCSPLTNALLIATEQAYQRPALELLEEKIFRRIGATDTGWFNTDGHGVPIAEGQLSLHLEDFARWASLMLNKGNNLAGEPVIPEAFIADTIAVRKSSQQAFATSDYAEAFPGGQYRNQFWITAPQAQQYAMLGIHGQFAWFDQSRELMICGYGSYPVQVDPLLILALQQLWSRIAEATDSR